MKSFKPKFNIPQFNVGSGGQSLKLIPLGGVGDVTKNMYVYEYGDDIIIVDCGVGFPDEDMPGVDLVIPDISYLRSRLNKIRAIILTHGHEDHIGALPFIWPELQVPIYTQRLTAGFIRNKFAEHNLPKDKINEVKIDEKLEFGPFKVSFYQVSHSVPDSTGIVIRTPVGTIIHQSDFKIDWTPISGQVTDVGEVARVGAEGVDLLLMDCLRVDKPGFNKSEKSIEATFEKITRETLGKILITMTSSNIARIQQAINVAQKLDRKVAVVGRSMEKNFQIARDLGYLRISPGLVIAPDAISSFAPSKVMILIAGSQGQAESSLARAANEDHKQVKLREGDCVVFSADPIPSTETSQNDLIDSLSKLGINVIASSTTPDLHVSGHAAQDELKLMMNLAKPKFILPIGGTFRHMSVFSKMAQDMGYDKKQIIDAEDGSVFEIKRDGIKALDPIEVQNIYVDGLGIGDVGNVILRDRTKMNEEGIVVVVVSLDQHNGKLISEPDILSRGFIFEEQSGGLLDEAKVFIRTIMEQHKHKTVDWRFTKKLLEESLGKYLYESTERRPLILSVVVEV